MALVPTETPHPNVGPDGVDVIAVMVAQRHTLHYHER
jgi:hypothetical protein